MNEVNQPTEPNDPNPQMPKRVSSVIPDYFKRARVFGVLPVDDRNGELRTGVSFQLESGETIWLNLTCTDAEWLCVTLRSWMSDYEAGKSTKNDDSETTI